MKLTKAQKREVYIEAAERIKNGLSGCCCFALQKAMVNNKYKVNLSKDFKEFLLFDPGCGIGNLWFGLPEYINYSYSPTGLIGARAFTNYENQNARITCLLLCAEMCK